MQAMQRAAAGHAGHAGGWLPSALEAPQAARHREARRGSATRIAVVAYYIVRSLQVWRRGGRLASRLAERHRAIVLGVHRRHSLVVVRAASFLPSPAKPHDATLARKKQISQPPCYCYLRHGEATRPCQNAPAIARVGVVASPCRNRNRPIDTYYYYQQCYTHMTRKN